MRSISLFMFMLFSTITAAVGLAAPIPNGENASTQAQFDQLLEQYYQRTIINAYKEVGRKNATWDASALIYLEAYIDNMMSGKPTVDELEELGRVPIDAGCDDPLVMYCYATKLHQQDKLPEAEKYLLKVLEDFKSSKYPRARAAMVPFRLIDVSGSLGKMTEKTTAEYYKLAIDWIAESLTDGSYRPGEQRIFLYQLDKRWDTMLEGKWSEVYDALSKKPKADPYILNTVDGMRHIKEGWQARGDGYANTVSEEGWKKFEEHLGKAYTALKKASSLRPEYPEAPTALITVAMAGEAPEGARAWFDKAAAAQIDYMQAYHNYLTAILPRWGGSSEEMLKFASECVATGRFDTDVPDFSTTLLKWIDKDNIEEESIFKSKKIFNEIILPNCEGYAKKPESTVWSKSAIVAAGAFAGEYAKARQALDDIEGKYDPKPFASVCPISPEVTVGRVYAMTGKLAGKVKEADTLAADGNNGRALVLYREMAAGNKDDVTVMPFLQSRIAELSLRTKFDSGEWIDLKPGGDFAGWRKIGGDWSVEEDGSIRGESKDNGLLLICETDFGDSYELRGDIEFAEQRYVGVNGGFVFDCIKEREVHLSTYLLSFTQGKASIRTLFDGKGAETDYAISKKMRIRLHFSKGLASGFINGKSVIADEQIRKLPYQGKRTIGIGGHYWYPGTTLKFSNLQIRKVK